MEKTCRLPTAQSAHQIPVREQTFSGQDMENYANMLRGLGFDVQIEQ